jgi:hypothetical protein
MALNLSLDLSTQLTDYYANAEAELSADESAVRSPSASDDAGAATTTAAISPTAVSSFADATLSPGQSPVSKRHHGVGPPSLLVTLNTVLQATESLERAFGVRNSSASD